MTPEQLQTARAQHWRQNHNPILTLEDARGWMERHPLCLFLPRGAQLPAPAPSFVEALMGEASLAPPPQPIDRARELVVRLMAENTVVALNLFGVVGEQADFLCHPDVLAFVLALRAERDWKQPPGSGGGGKVSPLVVELWKVLVKESPLTAAAARELLGRELTEAAVLRALGELWQNLRVLPTWQAEGHPALWALTQHQHRAVLAQGASTSQVTAISVLVSTYLQSVYAATNEEIEIFLSPLVARSRIREAVRGLAATGQIQSLSMHSQTFYFLEAGLPEFSVPEERAQPEAAKPEPVRTDAAAPEKPVHPMPARDGATKRSRPAAASAGPDRRSASGQQPPPRERRPARADFPKEREARTVSARLGRFQKSDAGNLNRDKSSYKNRDKFAAARPGVKRSAQGPASKWRKYPKPAGATEEPGQRQGEGPQRQNDRRGNRQNDRRGYGDFPKKSSYPGKPKQFPKQFNDRPAAARPSGRPSAPRPGYDRSDESRPRRDQPGTQPGRSPFQPRWQSKGPSKTQWPSKTRSGGAEGREGHPDHRQNPKQAAGGNTASGFRRKPPFPRDPGRKPGFASPRDTASPYRKESRGDRETGTEPGIGRGFAPPKRRGNSRSGPPAGEQSTSPFSKRSPGGFGPRKPKGAFGDRNRPSFGGQRSGSKPSSKPGSRPSSQAGSQDRSAGNRQAPRVFRPSTSGGRPRSDARRSSGRPAPPKFGGGPKGRFRDKNLGKNKQEE